MEQIYLENFIQEIKTIEKYIEHIELVDNLKNSNKNINTEILNNFEKHMRAFHVNKKTFEYKSIIISLYGLLESTVSIWIQEHIQNISDIVNDYTKLEEKFKTEHFNRSIQLIDSINQKKYSKFGSIDKENILKKLNQTIISPNNFQLNSEAFIPSSGNLRHSIIEEAFRPLDINLNILQNTLKKEIIKIDDLISRRNDIAHGVEIDNILGISEFKDFITALESYMTRIFNIISEKEIAYKVKHQGLYICQIKEVFLEGKVCIINIKNIKIKVGDTLFIEKNSKYSNAIIIAIKDDDKSIQFASSGEFGLELDCTIKKNSKIWKKELV